MDMVTLAMIEDLKNEISSLETLMQEIIKIINSNTELLERIQEGLREES